MDSSDQHPILELDNGLLRSFPNVTFGRNPFVMSAPAHLEDCFLIPVHSGYYRLPSLPLAFLSTFASNSLLSSLSVVKI